MRTREDGIRQVSNSELRSFKECRRRWYLGYVRRLKKNSKELGAASLGTRVHNALAAFYDPDGGGEDAMWAVFQAQEERDTQAFEEAGEDTKQLRKEIDLARAMVEGYVEWLADEGADRDLEVVAVEQTVEVASPHPGVNLVAKLDVQVRRISDGMRMFMDHKTVQDFTTPVKTIHLDEQMLEYHLIERMLQVDEPTAGAIYNMLRKVKRTGRAKPPFYARHEVYHGDEELRSFYNRVYGVIRDMLTVEAELLQGADHRVVAYPTPTRDCSWKCEFFSVCPMFDDGSSAEDVLELGYHEGDPYARYEDTLGGERT